MSRLSIFDPFKLLSKSPSNKECRCYWCHQRFETHSELSEHIGGTEQKNSDRGQECVPAYRCNWCHVDFGTHVRFGNHFELSEHTRGTTRSTSAGKPICLLDPLDSSSQSSRLYDKLLGKSRSSDQAATKIPNGEHGLHEKTDNAGLPNSHHCETIGEEDEEKNAMPDTETNAMAILQADGAIWKTFNDIARSMPPPPAPPPANVNRKTEPYEYWKQYTGTYGMVDCNPMQTGHIPSNSRTSAYKLPERLDTNASKRSYVTARTSSSASYRTAPSFSNRTLPSFSSPLDATLEINPRLMDLSLRPLPKGRQGHPASGIGSKFDVEAKTVDELEQQLVIEALKQLNISVDEWNRGDLATIISRHMEDLVTSKKVSLASLVWKIEETVTEVCQAVCSRAKQTSGEEKLRGVVARHILDYVIHLCNLDHLAVHLERHFDRISSGLLGERQIPVFSSQWIEHLRSRGILLDPVDELDWSGRGQHVEYEPKEEKYIPLKAEAVLGHSATAIVESVRCRRIKLARKRIRCSRGLTKEIVITEVEHLHRLQHAHILRVVGTYTLKKDLAILLYPATPWNLDEFMDELLDTRSMVNEDVLEIGT